MEPELLHDTILELKGEINLLKRENDRLKVRAQQAEEDREKKNKLLQGLVAQLESSNTTQLTGAHKEAALVIALKRKIRKLEDVLTKYKEENQIMKKAIKLTKQKELEDAVKAYEEECKRLRTMMEQMIESNSYDPKKHIRPEKRILEQKVTIKDLNTQLRTALMELERTKESETQFHEALKKAKVEGKKSKKRRLKITKQQLTIDEAKERITMLTNEKKLLEDKLKEVSLERIEESPQRDTNNGEMFKKTIERLEIEKANEKLKAQANAKKLLEKEKELREVKIRAKEHEDAYILKALEEKERLIKRIVNLELELKSKSKLEEVKKVPEPQVTEPIKTIREFTNPLVQATDLIYHKQLFKIVLIKEKKTFDVLRQELFTDYEPNERITIKELTKVFRRKPLSMKFEDAELLARYLIEPRGKLEVVYNKYSEGLIADIIILLDSLIDIKYPIDFWCKQETIMQSGLMKLEGSFDKIKNIASNTDDLTYNRWIEICTTECSELSLVERDFLMAIMFDNDLTKLNFSVTFI